MARIDIKGTTGGGGGGSGTVTSVGLSSSTLTVTNTPVTTSGTIVANIPDGYLKVGTGITGTLQNVVDTNGTATTLFLSSTAAQFTSPLRITTSDASGFYLDAEDSATNNRFSIKRDPSSQEVTLDFASNPAGSTTLVGAIRTYGDGVNLSNAMSFREDGNVGIGTDTPGAKLDIHSAGATVAQFNKTGSGNSYIQQLTAGAAKWKHGFTSASGAFDIIDDVNSLTRLSLLNTGQLKLNAYTSTSAFTGTTAGFLAFDSTGNILSVAAPGGGSPAGTTGAVQFNNGGAFGADSTQLFWDDTNNRLGIGTNAPSTTVDILPPTQTATATQFDCFRVGYSNSTIGVTNGSAFQVQVATTGTARYSTTLRLSGSSDTSQAYLKGFDSNLFGVMLNRTQSNLGLFSDNGIMLGNTAFAGSEGSASAQVHIKGSGSTSATTSLLVQNSAGSNWLQVKDDGDITNGANGSSELKFEISPVANKFFRLTRQSTNVDFYAGNGGNAAIETSGGQPFSLIASSAYLTLSNGGVSIGATFNTTNASAILDVTSTTKGFLPPRMTNAQRLAIATPAVGLMVYCTDAVEGLYVYKSTGWTFVI